MKVWGDKINLIDARSRKATDKNFWRGTVQGNFVKVHGDFWADIQDWGDLPPWERDRIKTLVVGHCCSSSIVIGRSAVRLWKLPLITQEATIELAPQDGKRPCAKSQWPQGIHYRGLQLHPSEIIERKGIRLTTEERSLIDLCRWGTIEDALAAVEGFYRRDTVNEQLLTETFLEMSPVPRIARVRQILKHASILSESPAESFAKALFIKEKATETKDIQQQAPIRIGTRNYRADFLIDGWLVVEIDGQMKYDGDDLHLANTLKEERDRERAIQNAGYVVVRAGWQDLRDGTFLKDIRRALAAKDARLRAI